MTGMTDEAVVEAGERIARVLAAADGFQFEGERVRNSPSSRGKRYWELTARVMDAFNGTDLAAAVETVDGD